MKNLIIIGLITACLCTASCSMRSKTQDNGFEPKDSSLVLLTLVYEGCNPCEQLLSSSVYQNCKLEKKIMNIQQDFKSRFIGQALWNTNFPTVYFITRNYDIKAITLGNQFYAQVDSILHFNKQFEATYMERHHKIDKDSILPLLSCSLKAVHFYMKQDYKQAKQSILQSLTKGSYFFNNYLLYKIYNIEQQTDSANLYKIEALKHTHEMNQFIYANLIQELHEND